MQFADFSPPASPACAEQEDALEKGLGRAMQWAMVRRLADEPLLAACLKDQRYDTQIEESRAQWLWKLVRAVDAVDRFRVPFLHALYDLSDERSANQLCEFAKHYAAAGDDTFRNRLYEIVERKPVPNQRWLGEEEIIDLDGEKAFAFAARVRGTQLASREWEWDDGNLVDYTIERFGEGWVKHLLEQTADPLIRVFADGWRKREDVGAGQTPLAAHRERMRRITVADIISAAESTDKHSFSLRGWGMHADESDLVIVLQHLRDAHHQTVICNLLKVFSKRCLPTIEPRIIKLCEHPDSEVRRWAFNALENNEHAMIRQFARSQLEKGTRERAVVSLFIKNYQQGDEQKLLTFLELPDDDFERHSLFMDVIEVLENNPGVDCAQLGIVAYASTPCGNCREKSVKLLLHQNAAPGWLIEECRFDAVEGCRQLVEPFAGATRDEAG